MQPEFHLKINPKSQRIIRIRIPKVSVTELSICCYTGEMNAPIAWLAVVVWLVSDIA